MEQQASTSDVARYLVSLEDDDQAPVEKVLVRRVSEHIYACQIWRRNEREPASMFINVQDA